VPDRATLDVIDRPGPGLRRSLRHLKGPGTLADATPFRAVLA
jgi:hypothetical protein